MSAISGAEVASTSGLVISILLPWFLGTLVMRLMLGQTPRHVCVLLGHGYLIGLILTSLVIRSFSANNLPLAFGPITACLAGLAAGSALLMLWRRRTGTPRHEPTNHNLRRETSAWATLVAVLLCLLIGLRFYLVAQEILLRPLFPWDAWDSWGPRTIQFFDNQALFAELSSIKRPHGLFANIIHLWSMLGANSYQWPNVNLPWVMGLAALSLAVYGHLQQLGVRPLVALAACYMVSSMPYTTLHTALAGYADIWLTFTFSLGIFAVAAYEQERRFAWVVLALIYAVVCIDTKYAGLGLAAIIIVCQFSVLIRQAHIRLSIAILLTFCVAAFSYGVMSGFWSFSLKLPWLGHLQWNATELRLGEIWHHRLGYVSVATPFTEVFFIYANWHLLVPLTLGTAVLCIVHQRWRSLARPELIGVALAVLYSYSYHAFTAARSAIDHTSLSRSLVYIAPIAACWVVIALSRTKRDS